MVGGMNLGLTDEQKEVLHQVLWLRRGCDREPPMACGFVRGRVDDLDNVRRLAEGPDSHQT
jgi:hypothetical protein